MKALVTGAAGFIASHIVDALRGHGAEVIGLDSLDPSVFHQPPSYLRADVDYCFTDLRSWQPDARIEDVEVIYHLAALGGVARAAREPLNVIDANCRGTARLLDVARGMPHLRRIVLAGSFSVYGANYIYRCPNCDAEGNGLRRAEDMASGQYEVLCRRCGAESAVLPITEATSPAPLETYGASKYMQELCFRGFTTCPATILRFSSVYGRRLRLDDGEATIIARIAGWIRQGQRPQLFEDGRQIRDWVYVGDIVAAALVLAEEPDAPSIINVCSGVPTRLVEACAAIAAAYGKDVQPDIVGGYRLGDMRHCLGDPSTIRQLLGRDPVPFTVGATMAFGPKEFVDSEPAVTSGAQQ